MSSRALAPFRFRDFRLRWFGAFVSNVGTWMETVALGYYVADLTGRNTWSALVAVAGFAPIAVLGPVGGVWADRLPKKHVMMAVALSQAAIAAVLAYGVADGWAGPGVITLLALLTGVANAVGFPAFQASVPELVPEEQLVAATSLFAVQWNLGRIIGPLAAAIAIAVGGIELALYVNAVSFFAVVVAVWLGPRHPPERRAAQKVLASIKEGFRVGFTEPGLRTMFLAQILIVGITSPFIAFVPQMAKNVLGGDEVANSIMITGQGVGAVAAGVAMGPLTHRFGPRRVLTTAMAMLCPAYVLYGLAPSVAASTAALVLMGALYLTCFASFTAIVQTRAPAALRGRLLAVSNTILGVLYPLSSIVQGAIADQVGLRQVTVAAGLVVGGTLAAAAVLRPDWSAPLDEEPVPWLEAEGLGAPARH